MINLRNTTISQIWPHLQEIALQYSLRLNRATELALAYRLFCVRWEQDSNLLNLE